LTNRRIAPRAGKEDSKMDIGITYDAKDDALYARFDGEERAELDSSDTIQAIADGLTSLGHSTERIGHIRDLVGRLSEGHRWDLVFNISEGFFGPARESQIPGLLEAYQIPYTFADPLVLAVSLDKSQAKRIARELGIPTAEFAVVREEAAIASVALPFPVFAKPLAEGTSKGISASSRVENRDALHRVCRDLLSRFGQPVLVETFLPGREFTVGVVGSGERSRAIGVMEVFLRASAEQGAYSYANKEEYESRIDYALADDSRASEAASLALAAWKGLGCRDAGRVDLRCAPDGAVQFMEVNPLPGLHPVRSDLPILCRLAGISYGELLEMIVRSAMERIDPAWRVAS
jgi:D-alanine-D-alanine ligase